MNFADLGLSDELLRAVTEAGYDTPTPIQAQAIPSVLMMRGTAFDTLWTSVSGPSV